MRAARTNEVREKWRSGYEHGFLYDGATFTTLDFPGSRHTNAHSIDGDKDSSEDETACHPWLDQGSREAGEMDSCLRRNDIWTPEMWIKCARGRALLLIAGGWLRRRFGIVLWPGPISGIAGACGL